MSLGLLGPRRLDLKNPKHRNGSRVAYVHAQNFICRLGYALALHCPSAAPSMSMSMSTSTSIGLYDPNVYGGECGKKFYACQPYSHSH